MQDCPLYAIVDVSVFCVGIQVTRLNGSTKWWKAIAKKKGNEKQTKIKNEILKQENTVSWKIIA